ncbi:MAG: hypothetical protein JRN50_04115 [Nitrososphaerota archaeon]|nr:hypothetical protein [Nitrososphaerota archaeon]
MPAATVRLVFDTSALLDLFGKWTDDHKQRRGDLVKEVSLLAPLAPLLFSTRQIREEVREHLTIAGDLDRYIQFEPVEDSELHEIHGYVENREADYSLTALALRLEREGHRVFVLTKDRSFARDLPTAGCRAGIVPPTGFAEAITVVCANDGTNTTLAHRLQNNAFVNLSRDMRLVKQTQGEAAYLDWQEFLNSRTADKHEMIETLKQMGH